MSGKSARLWLGWDATEGREVARATRVDALAERIGLFKTEVIYRPVPRWLPIVSGPAHWGGSIEATGAGSVGGRHGHHPRAWARADRCGTMAQLAPSVVARLEMTGPGGVACPMLR